MKTVIFHNPGELDIRGACIMGLSAKDDDQAIGKFGSGLKYAIASILRWGGAVSIETGGEKFHFHKKAILFRGKDHDQVLMVKENGEATELGFTTHYGAHWEPWQIFRELYSNALDEGGGVYASDSQFMAHPPEGQRNETIIRVHCEKVAECYAERDIIILPYKGEPTSNEHLFMLRAPSNFLYYRGVRVAKKKCLFTWNLMEGVQLSEDRTALYGSHSWTPDIGRFIQQCTDRDLIKKVVTAEENYIEADADFASWRETSPEFLDVVEECWRRNPKSVSETAISVLMHKREHLQLPDLVQLTRMQQLMLDKARRLLRMTDLNPDAHPCEVRALHKNTLGQAKDGKVILSPQIFEQGTKQVVSTWYEELMHLETGVDDCTYEMQTRLFNLIISLYEEHVFGEPC
jgi:hypothetical protein